jgi:hypothetical protein
MDAAALNMAAMSVVYSLYDALVSINVPDDKAKAVIDAMEREMMGKLATKDDLENFKLVSRADFAALRGEMNSEFKAVRTEMAGEFKAVRTEMAGEFKAVRSEMTSEFKLVRQEMGAMHTSLSKDIRNLGNVLTIKLGSIAVVMTGVLFGLLKLTS